MCCILVSSERKDVLANQLITGVYNRFVAAKSVLLNLVLVYIGNWLGCLLVAYFLGYLTDIFHYPQYRSYMDGIVLGKLEELSKQIPPLHTCL